MESKITRVSAMIYTGVSMGLVGVFLLLTSVGDYSPVARYGGAVWVFVLAMIITMPVVIPAVKKKYQP